jgi:hypothetical protein
VVVVDSTEFVVEVDFVELVVFAAVAVIESALVVVEVVIVVVFAELMFVVDDFLID